MRSEDAEGGFVNWMHEALSGWKEPTDVPEPTKVTVDRPDFNNVEMPEEDLILLRYGTPLDGADGKRLPLFDGPPSREQTQQGLLGDCGVIATMGAVAGHRPELISQCIRENSDGTYEVTLHRATYSSGADSWRRFRPTGSVIKLTVTPDLPVLNSRPDRPAYAKSGDSEAAWPSVLEKAIAGVDQSWDQGRAKKVMGYARLDRGSNPNFRAELLTQLTGEPAYTEDFPSQYNMQGRSPDRQLVDTFREKLAEGRPILVGTIALTENDKPLPKRLIERHAYEVTEVDSQGFIHLRNPYNKDQPKPLTVTEFRNHIKNRYTTTESQK